MYSIKNHCDDWALGLAALDSVVTAFFLVEASTRARRGLGHTLITNHYLDQESYYDYHLSCSPAIFQKAKPSSTSFASNPVELDKTRNHHRFKFSQLI